MYAWLECFVLSHFMHDCVARRSTARYAAIGMVHRIVRHQSPEFVSSLMTHSLSCCPEAVSLEGRLDLIKQAISVSKTGEDAELNPKLQTILEMMQHASVSSPSLEV